MESKRKMKKKNPFIMSFFILGIILMGMSIITLIIRPDFIFSPRDDPNQNNPNDDNSIENSIFNLSLTVDFGNGSIFQQGNITIINENPSVFNLMNSFFTIEFSIYTNGYLITSINNIANNPSADKNWFYWVNEISPNIASSSLILDSGDRILWNYTSWSYVQY